MTEAGEFVRFDISERSRAAAGFYQVIIRANIDARRCTLNLAKMKKGPIPAVPRHADSVRTSIKIL